MRLCDFARFYYATTATSPSPRLQARSFAAQFNDISSVAHKINNHHTALFTHYATTRNTHHASRITLRSSTTDPPPPLPIRIPPRSTRRECETRGSHVTCHTSHVTRHTSHIILHIHSATASHHKSSSPFTPCRQRHVLRIIMPHAATIMPHAATIMSCGSRLHEPIGGGLVLGKGVTHVHGSRLKTTFWFMYATRFWFMHATQTDGTASSLPPLHTQTCFNSTSTNCACRLNSSSSLHSRDLRGQGVMQGGGCMTRDCVLLMRSVTMCGV